MVANKQKIEIIWLRKKMLEIMWICLRGARDTHGEEREMYVDGAKWFGNKSKEFESELKKLST